MSLIVFTTNGGKNVCMTILNFDLKSHLQDRGHVMELQFLL